MQPGPAVSPPHATLKFRYRALDSTCFFPRAHEMLDTPPCLETWGEVHGWSLRRSSGRAGGGWRVVVGGAFWYEVPH